MSIFDNLKARPIGSPVALFSELLGEELHFKPLTCGRNQTYNIMGASLAQKILMDTVKDDTYTSNIYFLVRWTWINKDGTYVLDSESKYDEFRGDTWARVVVEEVIKLAVKAHQGPVTEKKTPTKPKGSGSTKKKRAN